MADTEDLFASPPHEHQNISTLTEDLLRELKKSLTPHSTRSASVSSSSPDRFSSAPPTPPSDAETIEYVPQSPSRSEAAQLLFSPFAKFSENRDAITPRLSGIEQLDTTSSLSENIPSDFSQLVSIKSTSSSSGVSCSISPYVNLGIPIDKFYGLKGATVILRKQTPPPRRRGHVIKCRMPVTTHRTRYRRRLRSANTKNNVGIASVGVWHGLKRPKTSKKGSKKKDSTP